MIEDTKKLLAKIRDYDEWISDDDIDKLCDIVDKLLDEIKRLTLECQRLRIACGPSEMIESDYIPDDYGGGSD